MPQETHFSAMMGMFATPSQKSDDSEEELGHRGRLMPVAEMVPGAGMMDLGGDGHGDGNNGDDLHEEEEDALELQ